MSKRHLTQPEWGKIGNINSLGLVFKNLTKGSNSIILSMVVLGHLAIFSLDSVGNRELNSCFDTLKAKVAESTESLSSVFSDHTDTID